MAAASACRTGGGRRRGRRGTGRAPPETRATPAARTHPRRTWRGAYRGRACRRRGRHTETRQTRGRASSGAQSGAARRRGGRRRPRPRGAATSRARPPSCRCRRSARAGRRTVRSSSRPSCGTGCA
eukprot:5077847-Prymnesium_polylepis.1